MMPHLLINGIVAMRDGKPYIQIGTEDNMAIAQLSMAQARQVARDIETMCARTEADAMILKFMLTRAFEGDKDKGLQASGMIMQDFRDFRAELDDEAIGHTHRHPPSTDDEV